MPNRICAGNEKSAIANQVERVEAKARRRSVQESAEVQERAAPVGGSLRHQRCGRKIENPAVLILARAFLTAGIPAALATLPGADHAALRDLIVGFHRHGSSGMAAEEAFATIKRNVLHSNPRSGRDRETVCRRNGMDASRSR
ncbi:MAG: CHAT domain-containing protein [Cyanobacteria bacterium]|nr:CHAT domain-containing protein [Cyanobacteriota bacterium]